MYLSLKEWQSDLPSTPSITFHQKTFLPSPTRKNYKIRNVNHLSLQFPGSRAGQQEVLHGLHSLLASLPSFPLSSPLLFPSHSLSLETGSHTAEAGLKLAAQLRLTLNFPFPCLYPFSARITGLCPQTGFVWHWGLNPGSMTCQASSLLTKQHPSLGRRLFFSLTSLVPGLQAFATVTRFMSGQGLNFRSQACKGSALPTEPYPYTLYSF